jgi:hypothetical protein
MYVCLYVRMFVCVHAFLWVCVHLLHSHCGTPTFCSSAPSIYEVMVTRHSYAQAPDGFSRTAPAASAVSVAQSAVSSVCKENLMGVRACSSRVYAYVGKCSN